MSKDDNKSDSVRLVRCGSWGATHAAKSWSNEPLCGARVTLPQVERGEVCLSVAQLQLRYDRARTKWQRESDAAHRSHSEAERWRVLLTAAVNRGAS